MNLTRETWLGACQQTFKQTKDDLRMTVLRKEKVHDNTLNRM